MVIDGKAVKNKANPTGVGKYLDERGLYVPVPSGSVTSGTGIIDFGAFPGQSDTSLVITGQSGILSGSVVSAWLAPIGTADHSADEHLMETIRVIAGNIVVGTGFTIYALNTSQLNEPVKYPPKRGGGGRGTRIWGQWTVAWNWV